MCLWPAAVLGNPREPDASTPRLTFLSLGSIQRERREELEYLLFGKLRHEPQNSTSLSSWAVEVEDWIAMWTTSSVQDWISKPNEKALLGWRWVKKKKGEDILVVRETKLVHFFLCWEEFKWGIYLFHLSKAKHIPFHICVSTDLPRSLVSFHVRTLDALLSQKCKNKTKRNWIKTVKQLAFSLTCLSEEQWVQLLQTHSFFLKFSFFLAHSSNTAFFRNVDKLICIERYIHAHTYRNVNACILL